MGNNPDDNKNKETPNGAGNQWEGDEVQYVWHSICGHANSPPPPNVKQLMKMMFAILLFSQMIAEKLEIDQGIAFVVTLASLYDDDITSTNDMHRRPSG